MVALGHVGLEFALGRLIHHELMFTRPIFGTPDLAEQGRLLNEVSRLIESGATRGKVVVEGFEPRN